LVLTMLLKAQIYVRKIKVLAAIYKRTATWFSYTLAPI